MMPQPSASAESIVHRQAEAALRDAASYIRNRAGALRSEEIHAKGRNDFATQLDLDTEERLVEALGRILPGSRFLTEENTVEQAADPVAGGERWIIDPIDGTTNFMHGLPCYAISVALERDGVLAWGCVYELSREECFTAFAGGGTRLNGEAVSVSTCARLEDGLIGTGFPYGQPDWLQPYVNLVGQIQGRCHGIRRWGSAAVDLAYTACGRLDGYFEFKLNPWDCAAGVLLVREAGGQVWPLRGEGNPVYEGSLLSGTPGVFRDLRAMIDGCWEGEA